MFDPRNRIHWVAAIVIAIVLVLIFGVGPAWGQEPDVSVSPSRTNPGSCGDAPSYRPRDSEPRLATPNAIRERLVDLQVREHPAGAGRVILWVCVLKTGNVGGILVHTTAGDEVLDSIALRVISAAAFTPARLGGQPVTVWIAQPVDFVPRPVGVDL